METAGIYFYHYNTNPDYIQDLLLIPCKMFFSRLSHHVEQGG